jgi:hypothetical protein
VSLAQWLTSVISTTWQAEIKVQDQPGQKVVRIPSQPIKLDMVVHAYHPSYKGGVSRRITVQVSGGELKDDLKALFKK